MKIDLTAFISSTGADVVNAVKSQGAVKHYTVQFTFPLANDEIVEKLEGLWPFGKVTHKSDGSVTAEYVVKPEEVRAFCETLSRACLPVKKSTAMVLQLPISPNEIPEAIKCKIQRLVRATDKIIWRDGRLLVFLEGCKDTKAVERRLMNILGESLKDCSAVARII